MRWMWIDRIVAYEPDHSMAAIKNVSLAEEHLHDHFPADEKGPSTPVMPASLIIEGMAQTAGILVGSVNRFQEKVILAKMNRVLLDREVQPGQTLRYEAEIDRIDEQGAATIGSVLCLDHAKGEQAEWETIGSIDLMFSHIDQNMSGLQFGDDNFVFSDNFRSILEAAGLGDLAPE